MFQQEGRDIAGKVEARDVTGNAKDRSRMQGAVAGGMA